MKPSDSLKYIRVIFYQVTTPQSKLSKIVETANEYFEKKEPFLFRVPSKSALEYIDQLLWSYPKDSFLPHSIRDYSCKDLIVITTSCENPNESRTIFNLTPVAVDNSKYDFTSIYEFDDQTSPQKKDLSQSRYQAYKNAGYKIISL